MDNLLEKIYSSGFKFLNSRTLQESYELIVKESLSFFDGFEGCIWVYKRGKLEKVYSTTPVFDLLKFDKDDIRYKSFNRISPKVIKGKDLEREKFLHPILNKTKIKSIIFVPISYSKKPTGLLSIWSKKANPNIEKTPSMMRLLGSIISLSIRKNELTQKDKEAPERILANIYNSALKFLIPLNSEETLKTIVHEAIKLVGGENGTILLARDSVLERVYATSPVSYRIETKRQGSRYEVFKNQKAKILHKDRVKDLEIIHPALSEMNVSSIILVPLTNQEESIGVLTVTSRQDRNFGLRDLEVLKLFGSFASLAIRKSQLYEEVNKALGMRDLFISLAAHELRTPLTSVTGYFQLLRGRIESKKPVPSKWLEDMDVETKRLKQIVEEFLEINRIRSGKFQYDLKEIRLKKLINRSIAAFKFSHPERKINFTNGIVQSDKIIGDRDKLIQVITNVLENAAKYSASDKEININLKNEPKEFVLEIVDHGQGIPKGEIPQIFKGFYKGKNSLHEGMGLGLYLAKNIMDDHHGKIEIASELEKGTTVKLKLPKL
ncbi:MAG TPA: GAF domain-containing sensor histidine kinase [Patescibacteria group bacterium]|nr:GAF domain-containing sensor histidine kinase [Patescibacteria group bacterium]